MCPIKPTDLHVRAGDLWPQLWHALLLMALTAALFLITAWLAPLLAADDQPPLTTETFADD